MTQTAARAATPPDPATLAPARLIDSDHRQRPWLVRAQGHLAGRSVSGRRHPDPAGLGYADVRNHLSTKRMRQTMQTDVFSWHGFTEIWIDAAWRKATPAFNLSLCQRFGLLPLGFDGLADSIHHPFDAAGNRHMEYVGQRGSFNDVPLDALVADFRRHCPNLVAGDVATGGADFLADVDREIRP